MTDRLPLDLTAPLPTGRTVLEASAGTGKTYALTALIARYIAEAAVPVDEILVVTFTRAAANELRERTREVLKQAMRALDDGQVPPRHRWMAALLETDTLFEPSQRRARLAEAIARFDDLTITTIHGFCQQTLGQLGLRSGGDREAVLIENTREVVAEVCRDLLVAELADDPRKLSTIVTSSKRLRTPEQVEAALVDTVVTVLTNPAARLEPSEHDAHDAADPEDIAMALRWAAIVDRACADVERRLRTRGQIGYDALVSGLRDALTDPERGATVAAQLADRYHVVLVDEFQDTDRVQWDVFDTAFRDRVLITVGDPKQAIYRFRGADVHAYLEAVAHSTPVNLTVNHRSDRAVLAGIEHIFEGATLGDEKIRFLPVVASDDALDSALGSTDRSRVVGPAVQCRMVPLDERLRKTRKTVAMPLVRPLILADVARRIIDLLDHHTITERNGTTRRIVPGDIAVLVPSHAEAHHVAEALHRAAIPAVRTRTGSVFQSPAVMQWRLLLSALSRPSSGPVVRAAALGWFLRTDVTELTGDRADQVLGELQEQAATMADHLRRVGIASFYDSQKKGPGLLETVLGLPDGERNITDLDHIAELLAETLHGAPSDAPGVLRTLEDLVSTDEGRSEATMRRIESDSLAVQVTTIHAAKGLEYPIVLVPFSFKPSPPLGTPLTYTSGDGHRVIDVATTVPWDAGLEIAGVETSRRNPVVRRHRAKVANEGDALRLLYVAFTRAQHRLEVWWAQIQGARKSAFARLLLDRFGDGPVLNAPLPLTMSKGKVIERDVPWSSGPEEAAYDRVRQLFEASHGAVEPVEIPPHIDHPTWVSAPGGEAPILSTATLRTRPPLADPSWKNWSFTRLSAFADHAHLATTALASADDELRPVTGGTDEDVTDAEGVVPLPGTQVAHLADVAGGTTFGTFVHTVLEELDFTAADLSGAVRAAVVMQARRAGLDLAVDAITSGLVAALRTPLGPLFGGRRLADFSPTDRLSELTFDIPIAAGSSRTGAPCAAEIGAVLLQTLDSDDPMRSFASELARDFANVDIAGWLNGSIDAVLRVPFEHDHRYVVVDYKTNRLHPPGAGDVVQAYRSDSLVRAMTHHRYPLQALLYSVALHRYLRWRLGPKYSPDDHLGGIGYLFVRGMVGADTPVTDGVANGVFSWRPPTATIIALDDLFATGRPTS